MQLIPSIASANQLELGNEIIRLKNWPVLHIDIEDGNFTPNITFGLKTLKEISDASSAKRIDVHLMVNNPCNYLDSIAKCRVEMVTAHIEALPYPMLFVNRARKLGLKAGLAINIKTDIIEIVPFIPIINHVFVMTAEPDNNGELLYPPAIEKAINIAEKFASVVEVYIDGAINLESLKELSAAGITGAAVGRSVFYSGNPYVNLCALAEVVNN